MKSRKYILISLAIFIACLKSLACGTYPFYYGMSNSRFEISEWSYRDPHYFGSSDSDNKNISDWQKLVGKNVKHSDIHDVVYSFKKIQLEEILNKQADLSNPIFENTFAKYLRKNNDSEIVNFLLLARRSEIIRFGSSDKWWYPSKEDLQNDKNFQSIIDEALAYQGKRLKDRYLLQAMRAAFQINNYDLCFSLWKNKISQLPNSEVKRMSAGYIGRILFQQKNYSEAIKYYALTDDINSFFWCVDNMTKENSDFERIKMLYKYKPSSPALSDMVQDICREAENRANKKDYNEYRKDYLENRKRYVGLRDFALKAVKENRSNNPAIWQYAAAFLTFLDGDANLANQYLEQAAEMKGTPFIKNNIQNFMILANAHTTAQCDSLFESLLPELKKLDKVKSLPFDKYSINLWKEIYVSPSLWWYPSQSGNNSFTKNEMAKITPAHLIPKYLELKDYTKVLLLAMAANSWTVTEKLDHYYSIYGTDIYFWMDVVPVENVIELQQLINFGGRNELERFLLARFRPGIDSDDFLNELIGTKYLRTAQFEKAIPYLSKVSYNYIKKMNIYYYFRINPFREKIIEQDRTIEKSYPEYKLNYAKRMLVLQTQIRNTRNLEEKAKTMLQYALALRRSANSGESWALTDYYLGSTDYSDDYNSLRKVIKDEWNNNLLDESDKYLKQAEMITKNPEIKAQCYLAKNYSYYNKYGDPDSKFTNAIYLSLMINYSETQTVKQFISECDYFYSYYKTDYKKEIWEHFPKKISNFAPKIN